MNAKRSSVALLLVGVLVSACGGRPATSGASQVEDRLLSPEELSRMLAEKDFFFVNTHVPYEGEIEQTDAFIAYDRIEENLALFPADLNAEIVLYCRSGRMSAIAADTLETFGYTNVWDLEGGMIAWEAAGFPLQGR
jgi:rhodanese-related sulfurtransferase